MAEPKYIELIDRYLIKQGKGDYNPPSYEWVDNTGEIVRCKDCKFASGDSRICMKFGHSPIGELDFCAWAERRTDE